jgi:uncharacterized membrane protein
VSGWSEYTLAMALFLGGHFVPRLFGLRARLTQALGPRLYLSLYGLVSVALLIWAIAAAGRAPSVTLWPQLPWMRWVPNIAMPLAILMALCGIGLPQPFTLGGRKSRPFDPQNPGFAALSRHPLLIALLLWAAAHLVPNGDLAHVVLFGSFAMMSLVAIPVFDAMARKALPLEAGRAFFATTSLLSCGSLADPVWCHANCGRISVRALLALLLWAVLLALHGSVIGVSPLPA